MKPLIAFSFLTLLSSFSMAGNSSSGGNDGGPLVVASLLNFSCEGSQILSPQPFIANYKVSFTESVDGSGFKVSQINVQSKVDSNTDLPSDWKLVVEDIKAKVDSNVLGDLNINFASGRLSVRGYFLDLEGSSFTGQLHLADRQIAVTCSPKSIRPQGACTPDINVWGFPSGCVCPEQYSYNEKIFKCELKK